MKMCLSVQTFFIQLILLNRLMFLLSFSSAVKYRLCKLYYEIIRWSNNLLVQYLSLMNFNICSNIS